MASWCSVHVAARKPVHEFIRILDHQPATTQLHSPGQCGRVICLPFQDPDSICNTPRNNWKLIKATLQGANMEPENTSLEKEKRLQTTNFGGFHVNFPGFNSYFQNN